MFWQKKNTVRFVCDPRLKGVIDEPYPAKKLMPDWYKRLESYHQEPNQIRPTPTLKRCPPFLDAMSAGWIIPLAADVHIKVQDNGSGISWETDFMFNMIENHKMGQISTHPTAHKVPIKILNHWLVETAPGWSCLFVPALNRPDKELDLMSGIVETDKYFEFVNFPGFVKLDNGYLHLKKGHPLMQVIPFKRDYDKKAKIEVLSAKDQKRLQLTRDKKNAEFSYYRNQLWEKKV